ncbi:MAG: DUF4250 domain-containing protein [Bacteroidaceae bacterium]|nr:DUF4250 domain-containing protein [Bacteroidaceae bacterium]
MDHLPLNDIPMLVSAVNMLLRDGEFEDLDDICAYFDVEPELLKRKLAEEGFAYSEELRKIG